MSSDGSPVGTILKIGIIVWLLASDNRIKIFLDALRVPRASNEIPSNVRYEEWENSHKFFCLLEDDALITKLSIEADILPGTYKHAEQKDVHIIMTAKIRVTSVVHYNLMFATDR